MFNNWKATEGTHYLINQQYHILKAKNFTFCLLCAKCIAENSLCGSSTDQWVQNHLFSLGHKENVQSLFKICNGDPLCKSYEPAYSEIVNQSAFDISMLLGKETSYVCEKDNNFCCLMCNQDITSTTANDEEIQFKIINHLLSKVHSNSVIDVCWVYRLKSKSDFLLFHKTILYCSLCKNIFHCMQNNLLQTIMGHLQTDKSHSILSEECDPVIKMCDVSDLSVPAIKTEGSNCQSHFFPIESTNYSTSMDTAEATLNIKQEKHSIRDELKDSVKMLNEIKQSSEQLNNNTFPHNEGKLSKGKIRRMKRAAKKRRKELKKKKHKTTDNNRLVNKTQKLLKALSKISKAEKALNKRINSLMGNYNEHKNKRRGKNKKANKVVNIKKEKSESIMANHSKNNNKKRQKKKNANEVIKVEMSVLEHNI